MTSDELLPNWRYRIGLSNKYDKNHHNTPVLRTRRDLLWIIDCDKNPHELLRGALAIMPTDEGAHFYFVERPCASSRAFNDIRFFMQAIKRGYWSECLFNRDGTWRDLHILHGGHDEIEIHREKLHLAQRRWSAHVEDGLEINADLDNV